MKGYMCDGKEEEGHKSLMFQKKERRRKCDVLVFSAQWEEMSFKDGTVIIVGVVKRHVSFFVCLSRTSIYPPLRCVISGSTDFRDSKGVLSERERGDANFLSSLPLPIPSLLPSWVFSFPTPLPPKWNLLLRRAAAVIFRGNNVPHLSIGYIVGIGAVGLEEKEPLPTHTTTMLPKSAEQKDNLCEKACCSKRCWKNMYTYVYQIMLVHTHVIFWRWWGKETLLFLVIPHRRTARLAQFFFPSTSFHHQQHLLVPQYHQGRQFEPLPLPSPSSP